MYIGRYRTIYAFCAALLSFNSNMFIIMAKSEGVNEQLKVSNAMLWVQKMNNIRNKASEIINAEVIFPD